MNEIQFYQKLRKNTPQAHWTRIENSVGSGMFDVNGCCEGREVWVELKEEYKHGVLLRPAQHAWCYQRQRFGSKMWVLSFDQKGNMKLYKPPFKVSEFQRWLRIDLAEKVYSIETGNWEILMWNLFNVLI